jgi:hypothetical protein
MGIFFEKSVTTGKTVKDVVADALREQPPPAGDVEKKAAQKAAEIAPAGYAKFNTGRFFGAVVLWGLIVGGAIVAEQQNLKRATDGLWAAAAIVLGVVVGFLAGEKPSA